MATDDAITVVQTGDTPEKKKRKRLKRLCAQIREQMEFYFGDANLSKDRFLKQQMDADPDRYVPLEVFLNFNKMRALTDDVNLIAKALSTSDLLSVSGDGLKVKRVTPVVVRENVDECTVYVEGLPSCADHEWVKSHFSKFGEVLYVSLPKYKSSGDIKGFAFVEFDSEEIAAKVCQNFNDDSGSEGLGKFPVSKQLKQLQKKGGVPVQKDAEVETSSQCQVKKNKRKAGQAVQENVDDEDDEIAGKKKRTESEQLDAEQLNQDGDESDAKSTEVHSDKENAAESEKSKRDNDEQKEGDEISGADESSAVDLCMKDGAKAEKRKLSVDTTTDENKECKRVRINEEVQVKVTERHKHKRRRQRHRSSSLSEVGKDVPQLRVIPKSQWLKLRSEYLALQKKSVRQLKSSLKNVPRKNKQQTENKKDNSGTELTFMPNVIVKVEVDKPTNRKDLKERLSGTGDIAYIDFVDEDTLGHIRCAGPEVASRIAVANIKGHSFSVLQGDEEQKYWSKILADRQKKRSSKQRTKKRGTEKIAERVEKINSDANQRRHIVFDD